MNHISRVSVELSRFSDNTRWRKTGYCKLTGSNISQSGVAAHSKVCRDFQCNFVRNFSQGKRILKIGPHLAKLRARMQWHLFWTHRVRWSVIFGSPCTTALNEKSNRVSEKLRWGTWLENSNKCSNLSLNVAVSNIATIIYKKDQIWLII